ncbi:cytochrome-c peroxidase [Dyadobacter sp. CY312]|uniref:cytochrome-c peroxidase n=1 Tax=Dyadobacter sp. CY312 TaxID=2907303 RepID=UPI001F31CDD5|nr:cytochrome c peroxidase [Dyadobacter sp. CY312]MCE7040371.1 cytochrome C peroxidase [Dyadobacter sp. CY312]
MNKFLGIVAVLLLLMSTLCCKPDQSPTDEVYARFNADLDTLIAENEIFLAAVRAKESLPELQKRFLKMRLLYKKTEAFAEYFSPTTVKQVNGAPLDEIEDEENAVFEPGGFQVIEELIYTDEPVDQEELVRHVRKTQVNIKRIQSLWKDIQITDSHVFDALRLELFRLITLGISGFDTPGSGNALAESRTVLNSFHSYINAYREVIPDFSKLDEQVQLADEFIAETKSFNDFDRAVFITKHINPLSQALHNAQKKASIPFIDDQRLLRGDAATLFEKNAFDQEALVSNPDFRSTPDRIALGQKLFYEGRISGNGKTNCGSCHQPALAYTDGLKTSRGFERGNVKRNAPTITYAGLQQAMFYDLRSPSLEDQAADVIHNKEEMHGSVERVAEWIRSDAEYSRLFKKAYPDSDSIQPVYLQNAIAAFVRSLSPFSSPFDRYMRGDAKALTDNQVAGFNLFMGKARCGTCHFMPLFNGTIPPDYQRTESEVLGVTTRADWKRPVLDPDQGRGTHNRFPQWRHSFKTSTVRNISKTAPYMHNGAFGTLQEVMEFYNEGGGAGLGLAVDNQTLSAGKLNLSQKEIQLVVDFMESLADQ